MKSVQVYQIIEEIRLKLEFKKVPKSSSLSYKYNKLASKEMEIVRQKCSNIASSINSNLYTIEQVKHFLYYRYIYDEVKNFWWTIKFDTKEIEKIQKQFFSKISFQNDKKIILEVNKNTKFDNINNYFIVQDNGENYASLLLYNKYISPAFYLKFLDYESKLSKSNTKQNKLSQVMHVIKGEMQNGKT